MTEIRDFFFHWEEEHMLVLIKVDQTIGYNKDFDAVNEVELFGDETDIGIIIIDCYGVLESCDKGPDGRIPFYDLKYCYILCESKEDIFAIKLRFGENWFLTLDEFNEKITNSKYKFI